MLDTDVSAEAGPYLTAIGFRVKFALHTGANVRSDTALLRWARRNRHIFVCHDKHKDGTTRQELFPEIARNGGKALRIGGRPGQDPIVSAGKLLANRDKWLAFFAENDGIVTCGSQGVEYYNRERLLKKVQTIMNIGPVAGGKVRKPKPTKPRPKRARPRPLEQLPLE